MKIKNLKEMEKIAEKSLRDFSAQSSANSATTIALSGDLGSGKTTFVQQIGKFLKINEKINSPTFVILKKYQIKNKSFPWKNLIHIDAYRLNGINDAKNIGLLDDLKSPHNLIFIEWAELIKKDLPPKTFQINFEYLSDTERELKINW